MKEWVASAVIHTSDLVAASIALLPGQLFDCQFALVKGPAGCYAIALY